LSGWVAPLFRRAIAASALALVGVSWLACQTPYEQAFGRAREDYTQGMISNPEAGADDLEARRPDGASTDAAIYKLRTDEALAETEEPGSVINVDIGGD
jgi:hypothetical protein